MTAGMAILIALGATGPAADDDLHALTLSWCLDLIEINAATLPGVPLDGQSEVLGLTSRLEPLCQCVADDHAAAFNRAYFGDTHPSDVWVKGFDGVKDHAVQPTNYPTLYRSALEPCAAQADLAAAVSYVSGGQPSSCQEDDAGAPEQAGHAAADLLGPGALLRALFTFDLETALGEAQPRPASGDDTCDGDALVETTCGDGYLEVEVVACAGSCAGGACAPCTEPDCPAPDDPTAVPEPEALPVPVVAPACADGVATGPALPPLSVPRCDGATVDLPFADPAGGPTLVYYFSGTCPACLAHARTLADWVQGGLGARMLFVISSDNQYQVPTSAYCTEIRTHYGLPEGVVAYDPKRALVTALGEGGEHSGKFVVLDPAGRIALHSEGGGSLEDAAEALKALSSDCEATASEPTPAPGGCTAAPRAGAPLWLVVLAAGLLWWRRRAACSSIAMRLIAVIAALGLLSCGTPDEAAGAAPPPGDPRSDLTAGEVAAFEAGRALFERTFTAGEGLGPYYNDASCRDCHDQPGTGGAGLVSDAIFLSLASGGGDVIDHKSRAIDGFPPPEIPEDAVRRLPPPLYGLGLLDTIDEEVLRDSCGSDPADGVQGIHNVDPFTGQVTRFGYKPFVTSLRHFVGEALHTEMGLTNPAIEADLQSDDDAIADPEVDDAVVDALTAYVAGLAPPAPAWDAPAGSAVFESIGCAVCHKPALGGVEGAYTDLCLHFMGEAMDDGTEEQQITGASWRTQPLWGLRFRTWLLHDGRAGSIEEAVAWHGGAAEPARLRYEMLSDGDRAALLHFLRGL